VQISPGPIGEIMGVIKEIINPFLGKPQWMLNQGRATLFYKYEPENAASNVKTKLKIEINTREHFTVFGLNTIAHEVNNRWFKGSALINTYSLEELMGTKLRALYQRKKGRDLFDMWIVLEQKVLDVAKVITAFQKYLAFDNKNITRAMFEKNMAEKLQSSVFAEDISILLAPTINWDLTSASQRVHQKIIALLPGEIWRGNPA
jgi:predicted nucleotidyltransferase component of viral defense system